MIDRFEHQGILYAIVMRAGFRPESTTFITDDTASMQVGVLKWPESHVVKPHVHAAATRTIHDTTEILVVRAGTIEVQFYQDDGTPVASTCIYPHDTLVLCTGGHSFRASSAAEIVIVKQGPYMGLRDKEFLNK